MYQALTNKLESSAMEGLVASAGLHKGDHCSFWSVFPVVRDIVPSYSIDPSLLNSDLY